MPRSAHLKLLRLHVASLTLMTRRALPLLALAVAVIVAVTVTVTAPAHGAEKPDKPVTGTPPIKPAPVIGMATPSCSIKATLPSTRSETDAATITMTTSGSVSRAMLDMIDTESSGGSKQVFPWRVVKNTKGIKVDDLVDNPVAEYLGAVEGPGGRSSCIVRVARSGKDFPDPPACTITTTNIAGSSWLVAVKATGVPRKIRFAGKELDLSKPEATVNVTTNSTFVVSVEGQGGDSTCAAIIKL